MWAPRRMQGRRRSMLGWVQQAEGDSAGACPTLLGNSEVGTPQCPLVKFAEHLTFRQPSLQTHSHLLSDGFGVNM